MVCSMFPECGAKGSCLTMAVWGWSATVSPLPHINPKWLVQNQALLFHAPHTTIYSPHFTLRTPHSTLHSTLHTPHAHSAHTHTNTTQDRTTQHSTTRHDTILHYTTLRTHTHHNPHYAFTLHTLQSPFYTLHPHTLPTPVYDSMLTGEICKTVVIICFEKMFYGFTYCAFRFVGWIKDVVRGFIKFNMSDASKKCLECWDNILELVQTNINRKH